MADISGLTIGLDLETINLERGLTGLRDRFRTLDSEMRNNLSTFDRSEKSVAKYETLIGGMNDKIKLQERIVESTRKEYEKMVEQHGEGSKQAEAAKRSYENQSATLNNLERAVERTTNQMREFEKQQQIANSGWTKFGDFATKAGGKLTTVGEGMKNVGSKLTKSITLPAVGAATAVGGMVAAFGWGRLTGMDAAKAQLEGLGYQAEDVERVIKQVNTAVQGTTMTMAEGTSVAAGALAAGIEEGEELEQYIRRVGNAAVGANRDINEMAMIFNRVQGSGRLMTEELNMIEDGMPGFSQAMAKHFGVSLQAFREMVTAGEVSSQDFMVVMDDFAGDMAEANANSWAGLVSNAKAYIGILGENLLGGVFEQSKDAVRDFVEVMKSDDLREWAVETGKVIGDAFTQLLGHVKDVAKWFIELESPTRNMILTFSGLAIAAGPVLNALGSISIGVGAILGPIGSLSTAIGAAGGLVPALGAFGGGLATTLAAVGPWIAGIALIGGSIALLVNHFRKDAIPAVDDFGDEVSDTTTEAVTGFIDMSSETQSQLSYMFASGQEITEEGAAELIASFDAMHTTLIEGANEKFGEQYSALESLFEDSEALSYAHEQHLLEEMQRDHENRSEKLTNYNERYNEIISTAKAEERELTSAEYAELERIKDEYEKASIDILSESEQEQLIIKETMAQEKGSVDARSAAETVKRSLEAKEGVVAEAQEQYESVVAAAIHQRDETGAWSEEEAQAVIDEAKRKYDETVGKAEDMHDDVVAEAQAQADEHIELVDWETGEILSRWDVYKKDRAKQWEEMTSGWGEFWEGLKQGLAKYNEEQQVEHDKNHAEYEKSVNKHWKSIKTSVSGWWGGIKTDFKTWLNDKLSEFNSFKTNLSKYFSDLWTTLTKNLSTWWNNIISNFKQWLNDKISEFNKFRTNLSKFFSDLWTTLTRNLSTWWNNIITNFKRWLNDKISAVTRFGGDVGRAFGQVWTNVTNAMDKAWSNIRSKFDGFLSGLVTAARNIGTGLRNAFASAFNTGMKSVTSGVNKIISGINWVLDKLSVSKKISTWTVTPIPTYEKGTDGHPEDGPAIVNDGPGKNFREAFMTPDGRAGVFPDQRNMLVNLPKGTSVLPGEKTKDLMDQFNVPKYAGGIGEGINKIWEWVSGGAKNLLDKAIGLFGSEPKSTGSTIWGDVAKGAFRTVKDAAVGFIDSQISDLFTFGGVNFGSGFTLTSRFGRRWGRMHEGLDYAAAMETPIPAQAGGRVTQSRYHPTYGNFVEVTSGGVQYRYAHNSKNLVAVGDTVRAGQHLGLVGSTGRSTGPHVHFEIRVGGRAVDPLTYQGAGGGGFRAAGTGVQQWAGVATQALKMTGQYSPANLSRLLMQMKSESGGNARAINNWDSNARRGTPSKGLMQVIDPTFRAYRMPGYNNIWNPLDNILASIRYATSRYGSLARAYRGVGYATGGLVGEGMYHLAEEGWPEWIIPTDPARRTDAQKLLALAGRSIGNKRPDDLPDPNSSGDNIGGDTFHIHVHAYGDLPPQVVRNLTEKIEKEMKKASDRRESSRGGRVSFG